MFDIEKEVHAWLTSLGPLNREEADALLQNTDVAEYKKGSVILREGAISTKCFFILRGCIRQFRHVEGEERTIDFYTDKEPVISYVSYIGNSPSQYALDCLEDSLLVSGSKEQEVKLLKHHPRLKFLTQLFMQQDFSKMQERLDNFLNLSAEDRCRQFMETRPDLLGRVPLQYIAGYLGITPESFSRIRKRVILKLQGKSE